MGNKYISFSPYFSGLSNVIMSYELAFAISYITGRTLILPPKTWLLFISKSQNIQDFSDIWEIFDKQMIKSEFDCVEFKDVPEIKMKMTSIRGDKSFTENIGSHIFDLKEIFFGEENNLSICDNHLVVFSGEINDDQDFKDFSSNRKILSLDFDNKFIHFENNLFGNFWYHVYPGDYKKRNELKTKINKCFKYKKKYYDISKEVKNKIGTYNSLHIRRGDFLYARPELFDNIDSPSNILEKTLSLLPTKTPIYIATDEKNISFFDQMRSKYEIYFFDDFKDEFGTLTDLDRAVLEQVICAESEEFYGTSLSTYTKRINVMRGCAGKSAYDWVTWDEYMSDLNFEKSKSAIPWQLNSDKLWYWTNSYHPQWTYE